MQAEIVVRYRPGGSTGMRRNRSAGAALYIGILILAACGGSERPAGVIHGPMRASEVIASEETVRTAAAIAIASPEDAARSKQILFGDLHVHSTYSIDAFMYSLPIFAGEGAHPPADACDFARYCSGLDFFSINDHAEGLTPDLWARTKQSIRQCNALAGDSGNPDLVAFMGWEWTQTGETPETHFGHKNVIFPGLAEDELPKRPISAVPVGDRTIPPRWLMDGGAALIRFAGLPEYADVISFMAEMTVIPDCEQGVNTRDLPLDCRESAETPGEFFHKLDEWGFESLVIPHGLAWGVHAPPGASLGVQLSRAQHDPEKQRLIEIWSGHGGSEEFRSDAAYRIDAIDDSICPNPTPGVLPCCWQAGEIMRKRCSDPSAAVCDERVEAAKQAALDAGMDPYRIFPDSKTEDWLDCDQCRDCFKPASILRPGQTAQYGAAITSFEDAEPQRFRWGFISSTDNHAARPATGYKQFDRRIMTDARGPSSQSVAERIRSWTSDDGDGIEEQGDAQMGRLAGLFDTERGASFLYPGGIVAAHSEGRDRTSIWEALMRREVYGTSGPRMLLWFDLVNAPNGAVPMGSEVEFSQTPLFRVRAVGARKQKPGCPQESLDALDSERLHGLCRNECYYPSDEHHLIHAIEVIRIRPQLHATEPIAPLIEDPWRRFECPPDPAGCVVEFRDDEHAASERDSVYYVRVLQEETPAINGANVRTRFDEAGNAVSIEPCFGGYRTPESDDCLAPVHERAWSSPIYVDHPALSSRKENS